MALGCDLVWASAWMDEANEAVAPRIGLPRLPVRAPAGVPLGQAAAGDPGFRSHVRDRTSGVDPQTQPQTSFEGQRCVPMSPAGGVPGLDGRVHQEPLDLSSRVSGCAWRQRANFSMAAGVTGVKKLTRLPSGSRNSSERLPQGIVVGLVTKSVTKPVRLL